MSHPLMTWKKDVSPRHPAPENLSLRLVNLLSDFVSLKVTTMQPTPPKYILVHFSEDKTADNMRVFPREETLNTYLEYLKHLERYNQTVYEKVIPADICRSPEKDSPFWTIVEKKELKKRPYVKTVYMLFSTFQERGVFVLHLSAISTKLRDIKLLANPGDKIGKMLTSASFAGVATFSKPETFIDIWGLEDVA